jgi:16S rRNA (cytidine1402-2'-O)-methyltransferase
MRALRVLGECDAILAEDTRRTQHLLARYEIRTPLRSFHAHSEPRVVEARVAELADGRWYALVSDAGTPVVSDPGAELIAACIEAGVEIEALPGPSAVITSLVLSGLRSDGFRFLGFLPRSGKRRKEALEGIARDRLTTVLFESPHRAGKTLSELAEVAGAQRRAAVARELTKLHEEVIRGTLAELEARLEDGVRGEVTIVVEGAEDEPSAPKEIDLAAFLEDSRARGEKLRDASKRLARLLEISGAEAYKRLMDQAGS